MTSEVFDTMAGAAFLDELESSPSLSELEAILEVTDMSSVDFTQEQLALIGVVAEMAAPRTFHQQARSVAQRMRLQPGADTLYAPAHTCVDRLLANPFAPLWRGHADGGIAIKREARALRARLHRACSE